MKYLFALIILFGLSSFAEVDSVNNEPMACPDPLGSPTSYTPGDLGTCYSKAHSPVDDRAGVQYTSNIDHRILPGSAPGLQPPAAKDTDGTQ